MSGLRAPVHPVRATHGMASTVDAIATTTALGVLQRGGTAADAAIAANAVLTVTLPNQCGLGGDLFAIVTEPGRDPEVLVSAGRAGTGANAQRMRDAGLSRMPLENDIRSVTMPGCVDGWLALSARHGSMPLSTLLSDAIGYGIDGFAASEFLAAAVSRRAGRSADAWAMTNDGRLEPGDRVRRPGAARVLGDLASGGRGAVFEGEFGRGILEASDEWFTTEDLARDQAEWMAPLSVDVWGHRLLAAPPPSQGYVLAGAAWMASSIGLPNDPDDPAWAHLLIEAIRQSSVDRGRLLFDGADPAELLDPSALQTRASAISATRSAVFAEGYRFGGTTYLSVVDARGGAVSLIQSNCMSFGSGLVAGSTGIWLQNRGIGFSLEPGHPAELAAGKRPAHTLCPAMVVDDQGRPRFVLGSRGGDSQPQIVLQLLARALAGGADPADAVSAGRWILRGADDDTSFRTWESNGRVRVAIERNAPTGWADGLRARGHVVEESDAFDHAFGHAQLIAVDGERISGAADPRSDSALAAGY